MSLSRDSRQEKQVKAVMRAEFALKQRLERIDFEEDKLNPVIEDLKAGRPVFGLPAGVAFDVKMLMSKAIEVETVNADSDSPKTDANE